jgi:hypothetical protein
VTRGLDLLRGACGSSASAAPREYAAEAAATAQAHVINSDCQLWIQKPNYMQVAEMILSLSDEQHELSRSDFQSRVEVIARKIVLIVRDAGWSR